MNFVPKSAAEIAAKSKPLTGIFPARVHTAEAQVSKKGVDMIKLDLTVYFGDKTTEKSTYLHPAMEVLVYHFCDHAGLLEEYNSGSLTADMCEGKDVMVKLGIEKGKDGYQDKSVIKDFVPRDTPATDLATGKPTVPAAPRPPKDPDLDTAPDDIPF
jgi:hypothetical protein